MIDADGLDTDLYLANCERCGDEAVGFLVFSSPAEKVSYCDPCMKWAKAEFRYEMVKRF